MVLNGWLEHFKPADLRATYATIWGWNDNLPATAKRLQAGAVITNVAGAISRLQASGYVVKYASAGDTYLVKRQR